MKKNLIRIIASSVLFACGFVLKQFYAPASIVVFAAVLIISGYDVILDAFKGIVHGDVFDENFLMTIAAIGAVAIGEIPEGAAVMLFFQVGELFQSYAVGKSRRSICALMDIRPDYANVKRGDTFETADPNDVDIGDIIMIKPGEKVPLDAVVIQGTSALDTMALTGESVPCDVTVGDEILSASINKSGLLFARVTKQFSESTVSKILDLVENAADNKSKSEDFITKFARYYTPSVVIAALLLAVVPPLVIHDAVFKDWIYRALTFLVISCPCALVISIPLSFFGGIGAASKNGILIKGSNYLEDLSKAEVAVFDKTGTLTKGVFAVEAIYPEGMTEEELLETAAYTECFSDHPISVSLTDAYGKNIDRSAVKNYREIPGHGITAEINEVHCAAGNMKLMDMLGITPTQTHVNGGTVVHIAKNGKYAGCIVIADEIKPDSFDTVSSLKTVGIKKTVMLTGDSKSIGESVGKKLGIDEIYTQLLPTDKVARVEQLLEEKSTGGKLIFTGDGINDAPVLALSDLGIAMGGVGSDAAIEAADIVIMTDEPSKIVTAIRISKKTLRIVKQNIVFALAVKFLVLILGAFGFAPMWAAVFADVGVAVIAILNAVRVLRFK